MTDKKRVSITDEFDPEKNKKVDKGPLKSEHKNQYGNQDRDKSDGDLSELEEKEKKKKDNR